MTITKKKLNLGPRFYVNQKKFTGGEENPEDVFLNAIDFRKHISKFFKSGHADRLVDPVHWYFVDNKGVQWDSYDLGFQAGSDDTHCTIYSLYFEVFTSKYKNKYIGRDILRPIDDSKYMLDRLRNLRRLYIMLKKLFSDTQFCQHVLMFRPWSRYGDYIRTERYVSRAQQNIQTLTTMINRELKRA